MTLRKQAFFRGISDSVTMPLTFTRYCLSFNTVTDDTVGVGNSTGLSVITWSYLVPFSNIYDISFSTVTAGKDQFTYPVAVETELLIRYPTSSSYRTNTFTDFLSARSIFSGSAYIFTERTDTFFTAFFPSGTEIILATTNRNALGDPQTSVSTTLTIEEYNTWVDRQ